MKDAKVFLDGVRQLVDSGAKILVLWSNDEQEVARVAQVNMTQKDIINAISGLDMSLRPRV